MNIKIEKNHIEIITKINNNMKNMLQNWKTTSLGITSIVGGITMIVNDKTKLEVGLTAILGGIGLLLAADGKTPMPPSTTV